MDSLKNEERAERREAFLTARRIYAADGNDERTRKRLRRSPVLKVGRPKTWRPKSRRRTVKTNRRKFRRSK